MIFVFFAAVLLIFALFKKQLPFMLMAVGIGCYGTVQELLLKPELSGYNDLLVLGGELGILIVVATVIWFAAWRKRK